MDDRQATWGMIRQSLNRPYRVTIPMVLLVSLVPFYLYIAWSLRGRQLHMPELAWDRALPVWPVWALIYGALYLFLIALPVFTVREHDHLRRTVWAYLFVWITSYVIFMVYPTAAPRGDKAAGEGFAVWGLQALYSSDPPYNCFPSIHVAHSFVSALTCYRLNRTVGLVALLCASLVALSTLFTKQHYILDVIGGMMLAGIAYVVFLRGVSRETVPELDRRLAPVFATGIMAGCALAVAGAWVVYIVTTVILAS
jgi:membrane-associated phospholipid phosphatase